MPNSNEDFSSDAISLSSLSLNHLLQSQKLQRIRRAANFFSNASLQIPRPLKCSQFKILTRTWLSLISARYPNAMAVVNNLNELEAPVLDGDADASRTRIQTILQKLFQCRRGSLNDLPCCNPVYHGLFKPLDRRRSCHSSRIAHGRDLKYSPLYSIKALTKKWRVERDATQRNRKGKPVRNPFEHIKQWTSQFQHTRPCSYSDVITSRAEINALIPSNCSH